MRYAVCSDIHGNLEALSAVCASAEVEGAESLIFLGDAVGYGADPGPALDRVKSEADVSVIGNHDYVAAGMEQPIDFSPDAREAVLWTRERLSREQREYLTGLDAVAVVEDFTAVHATPLDPLAWEYLSSQWEAEINFPSFETRLCFVGHTHLPAVYWEDSRGRTGTERPGLISLQNGHRYIINVGSVGQPRDGDPRACYAMYDTGRGTVDFFRVDYDVASAQDKILKEGLPTHLARRLAQGI